MVAVTLRRPSVPRHPKALSSKASRPNRTEFVVDLCCADGLVLLLVRKCSTEPGNAAQSQPFEQNLDCDTARLGNNLVLNLLGHGGGSDQLHGVLSSAVGHTPQVACVMEHLSQRHFRIHDLKRRWQQPSIPYLCLSKSQRKY